MEIPKITAQWRNIPARTGLAPYLLYPRAYHTEEKMPRPPRVLLTSSLLLLMLCARPAAAGPDLGPESDRPDAAPADLLAPDAGLPADLSPAVKDLHLVTAVGSAVGNKLRVRVTVKQGGAFAVSKGQWFMPKGPGAQPLIVQQTFATAKPGTYMLLALCMDQQAGSPVGKLYHSRPLKAQTQVQLCQRACGNDQACVWSCQDNPEFADLSITTLHLPHSGTTRVGLPFTGKFRVSSTGKGLLETDFVVRYEYCVLQDNICTTLGHRTIKKDLPAGSSHTFVSGPLVLPAHAIDGARTLRVTVDALHQVKESREDNNVDHRTILVTGGVSDAAPLEAAADAGPAPSTDWRSSTQPDQGTAAWSGANSRPGQEGCSVGGGASGLPGLLLFLLMLGRRFAPRA